MTGILTAAEAQQVRTLLASDEGTEQVHGAMVEAAKFEYGYTWTEDHGFHVLEARLALDAAVEAHEQRAIAA